MSAPENVTPKQKAKAKKLRVVTAILLLACTLVLLAWDVKVATNDVRDDTISELLRDVSYDFWTLPFMLMGVMGHLFWNKPGKDRAMRPRLLVGSCVLVGLRDLLGMAVTLPVVPYANLVVAVAGFVLGAMWWPQLRPEALDDAPTTR